MENNNFTIFQKLTKMFGYPGQSKPEEKPNFNFNKDIILKTDSKEEYEKAILQAQQSHYIADKWTKLDSSLYNQSVYYEPNRLAAYYDFEAMEFTPEISAALDIYSEESCLIGTTEIPLLDGSTKTIEELFNNNIQDFYVYGVEIKNDLIKPSKVDKVIYKGIKDIFKVTLDDNSEIFCTDNHKWLLTDNTWIETKNLVFGSQLKSITGLIDNHRVISVEYAGQNKVYDLVNSSVDSTFGVNCNNGMIISHNCTLSEKGKILTIFSESDRVKSILEDLFDNKLDINTNLQMWARGVCKYGDDFVYLKINPEKGIIGCQQLPNIEIERIEGASAKTPNFGNELNLPTRELRFTWKNKDLEFQSWEIAHFRILGDDRKLPYGTCLKSDTKIKTENGLKEIKDIEIGEKVFSFDLNTRKMDLSIVLDKVKSGIKETYKVSTTHHYIVASKEHKIMYFDMISKSFKYKNTLDLKIGNLLIINNENDNDNDNFILEPIISIEESGENQTYDIYVENENHNFYANGIVVHNSMLDKIRRIWKQLLLAEDAMLIYRTSRAPERRVFKVFVGNMDDKDIEPYVQRVANKFKRDVIADSRNGQVDMRYNQMSVDQDYFIPVRDPNQTMPIETLAGAQNLGEIADIEYIQKKLLAALRIPKAFIGFEEVVGEGKTLALMDIRFARTINRIQKSLIQELNKIAILHLFLLGFEDELDNFSLSLTNPSAQSDLLRIEQWKEKITLYKDATSDQSQMGIIPVSHTWAKKNILGMSDSEVILDLQQQRLERAMGFELTNTQNIIKRSGVFDEVDSKYGISEEERKKIESSGMGGGDPSGGEMGLGGGSPTEPLGQAPPVGGNEPLNESTKDEKLLKMFSTGESFNDLFDVNKAQRNIYEITNKLNNIIND